MLEVQNSINIGNDLDKPLSAVVSSALERYFKHLDGEEPIDLYKIVIGEFEPPLLEAMMYFAKGNQVRAAKLLGISRGTLRKKLMQYFNTTHVGTTAEASR
jgi:Fis family transcriptional regulator, factor for inversion stimulation protein